MDCRIEAFMLSHMTDSAHDKHHIYRVLNIARDIAKTEPHVNHQVLTAACLLHDIGRDAQAKDPTKCHAQVGAQMALDFLQSEGWSLEAANHVSACISTHRVRGNNTPQTIEAKILFDADKIDVAGAIGIARTLMYAGKHDAPLYVTKPDGTIATHKEDSSEDSFVGEYHFKLKKIYGYFYTARGKAIAAGREKAADDFYHALLGEIGGLG